MRYLVLALTMMILWPSVAMARDMGGKLGFGFSTQLVSFNTGEPNVKVVPGTNTAVDRNATNNALRTSLQAFSLKYGITPRFNLQALAGFMVGENDVWGFGTGLKVWYIFIDEEYVNFYGTVGAKIAMLAGNQPLDIASILVSPGIEFFIPGIESVGFFTEFGLEMFIQPDVLLTSTSGNVYFGLHYHF